MLGVTRTQVGMMWPHTKHCLSHQSHKRKRFFPGASRWKSRALSTF